MGALWGAPAEIGRNADTAQTDCKIVGPSIGDSGGQVAYSEDAMSNLFNPDFVLPEQFANRGGWSGERRLMLAALGEAVATLQHYFDDPTQRGQRLYHEAREWIRSDDTSWAFAFEPICSIVGIDPDYLRQGLASWMATRRGSATNRRRLPLRRVNGRRISIAQPTSHLRKSA